MDLTFIVLLKSRKKNGTHTVLFIWNQFRLTFATAWNLRKNAALPLYLLPEKFFHLKTCTIRTSWSMRITEKKTNLKLKPLSTESSNVCCKALRNKLAATINLNFSEIFHQSLPKKLKNFAHRQPVKPTSAVTDPSVDFIHWLNLLMI